MQKITLIGAGGHAISCIDEKFPIIKSSRSYISKDSIIGEGSIIMHDVVINANVRVGKIV